MLRGKKEQTFWFSSLGQMLQFYTMKFRRTFKNYFGQFVWIEKKMKKIVTIIVAFHFMKSYQKLPFPVFESLANYCSVVYVRFVFERVMKFLPNLLGFLSPLGYNPPEKEGDMNIFDEFQNGPLTCAFVPLGLSAHYLLNCAIGMDPNRLYTTTRFFQGISQPLFPTLKTPFYNRVQTNPPPDKSAHFTQSIAPQYKALR